MQDPAWPVLEPERDGETFALLHLASQMVGKIRVRHAPWTNHGWHLTLRVSPQGLSTLPTSAADGRTFTLALDLCRHHGITLEVSDGGSAQLPFAGRSIADLHSDFIGLLDEHKLPSRFHTRPNEVADAVPFSEDRKPRAYDPDSASRLHRVFQVVAPVFERFRAGFVGKSSPVHFFWGSFDLAVTRFSGRTAPEHPGGVPGLPDRITREAYSHEVSSAGFWPGGVVAAEPIFYSYAYPEPAGFRSASVLPPQAGFDEQLGEFTLSYEAVRGAPNPEERLMQFLQSTYAAAADAANWNRAALERDPTPP